MARVVRPDTTARIVKGSTRDMGQERDALTLEEWDRTRKPATPVQGRAPAPPPAGEPAPPPPAPAERRRETAPAAARRPALRVPRVDAPRAVSDVAGVILAVLAWAWVGLPALTGGPAAVKATLRAKFLNQTPDGKWLP